MNVDVQLFHWVNGTAGWDALEPFMKAMSDFRLFVPVVLLSAAWMVIRDGVRGRIMVLALLLTVPASDQISSHLLKPLVGRPRPCRPESGLVGVKTHGVHCSKRGAFPSSHASNTASAWILLASSYRAVWFPGALVVLAVGWSRVYLGVHYPGDVLGGWCLGALLGGLGAWGARFLERRRSRRSSTPAAGP